MNIRIFITRTVWIAFLAIVISCSSPVKYYSVSDFENVPKIDAHFHYLTMDGRYMEFASSQNFRLLSINWDGEYSIDEQMKITSSILSTNQGKFAFFGTFSVESFGEADFVEKTIARINECMKAGAAGIKIWKNIGMVLKDQNGQYVMIDDPVFESIFTYLEQKKIPVMGHLGEPKDCWLPENEMIDPGALSYFKENPEYYMYLHPEAPSYDDQINSRDSILKKYPKLDFIGAHLASLEGSVDELAKRLNSYPNLKVDMAARMYPIQYQSNIDREKVRNFMIRYQDRILYGTDFEVHDAPGLICDTVMVNLYKGWLNQWIYMATDSVVEVKGLKLPKEVIDKIYFKNAEQFFQ
jgi:predicted TIM-barrel fold metal-dependent hydrolase